MVSLDELEKRVNDLQKDVSWYKGAFWASAALLGLCAGGALVFLGTIYTGIDKAKNTAIESIQVASSTNTCAPSNTLWQYERVSEEGHRGNKSVRTHSTVLFTNEGLIDGGGFRKTSSDHYTHPNEQAWRYDSAKDEIELASVSPDREFTYRFVRLPQVTALIYQTVDYAQTHRSDETGEEYHELRLRLISPTGCTKLQPL